MSSPATVIFNFKKIQELLHQAGLAGWLIYDFRGLNAVARQLFALGNYHITRRWFYFIPVEGEPVMLVHKIEARSVPLLPGRMQLYVGWRELHEALRALLPKHQPVAMEYSPMNDVPTVSYIDAGMLELIRSLGVEVTTSAPLIQEFQARWSPEQLQTHIAAAQMLHRAQQKAFRMIEEALRAQKPINEFEVQSFILNTFAEADYESDSAPIVAVNGNISNPHYAPSAEVHSPIRKGDVILIDLWAKQKSPGATYADITWIGYAGKNVPARVQEVFNVVTGARDLAVAVIREHLQAGKSLPGFRVDEAVREHIQQAGYGDYVIHRTGHSLGTLTHDYGVNIDSYETRDTREITRGIAFSVEPGIYLPEFGIRSEINVYIGAAGPEVHTEPQREIVKLEV